MTTITVQVNNEQNAALLQKMLKALSFVDDVEIQNHQPNLVEEPKVSYQKLKKNVDKIEGELMFKDIQDPSKWQSDLRDEWGKSKNMSMVIEIKEPITKEKVQEAIKKASNGTEKKSVRKHFGKLQRGLNSLDYQKEIRNEFI